jgi:hypothetical protein
VTLKKIDSNLIKSDSGNLPQNLIAIAVLINEKLEGQHSGLIIGVEGVYYLFHYTGESIELENPVPTGQWYFHKSLDIIPQEESETFLWHCQKIKSDNRDLKYGFMFDGSYYHEGKYFTESNLPEFSTCVGFCINVISGYLYDQKYIEVSDWENEPIQGGFQRFFDEALIQVPNLDQELYKTHHKRITPAECTASAYIDEIPVRKNAIDAIIENVKISIQNKRSI